ncbi:MAG TPA: hypothetical protein VFL66_05155 [Gaiellaceae bacterium]|nr:hypothetical protein [Gaiellaceae bacterium]
MHKLLAAAIVAASLASVAATAGAATAPTSTRFDLATGAVNGKVLLGKSPQALLAALGKPTLLDGLELKGMSELAVKTILETPSSHHHVAVWGKGKVWHVAAQVGPKGTRQPVVWSLIFADPTDRESRLGPVLTRKPRAIGQSIRNHYEDSFEASRPYACGKKPGSCYGVFSSKDGRRKITFGLFAGSKIRFLNLWLTGN